MIGALGFTNSIYLKNLKIVPLAPFALEKCLSYLLNCSFGYFRFKKAQNCPIFPLAPSTLARPNVILTGKCAKNALLRARGW